MTKGREKSDLRTVPAKRGNARRGRAETASQRAVQLELFRETADSPKGADGEAAGDRSPPATCAVPKSRAKTSVPLPAMTMEEVARDENLREAFRRVASNKGAPGPDRQSIEQVRSHLDEMLPELRRALLRGNYRPGAVRRVWIPKAGGRRALGIPNVVDRMVQQAVAQVLGPHYDRTFHDSSHGFRPGRSCHTAIVKAVEHLEEGHDWVVDIDLEQFFDRVNHQRLLARLQQRVLDARLLELLRRMLRAKVVMPDGVVVSTDEGTPQGGPLSPLLSNIVLDELDWELDRRGHRFVRYADDCNIYVRSERSGRRVMASVTRFIRRRLRLRVNETKSAIARPEERHFVGFSLRRDPREGLAQVWPSKRSKERIDDKIRELTPRTWGQSLRNCIQHINRYLRGWIEFFRVCTREAVPMLRNLSSHLRRRLRVVILRQRKRKRHIARLLIKRGVRPKTAWQQVYCGKRGLWALSHRPAVERALSNAYLAKLGLVSLDGEWKRRHPESIANAPRQPRLASG